MPDIQSIRQQYPQYGDMSDDQFASALHSKFYADMPEADFRTKIGLKDAPKDKPKPPGRFETAISQGPIGMAGKVADTAITLASGALGGIAGGIVKAGGYANQAIGLDKVTGTENEDPNEVGNRVARSMTHTPSTEAGKKIIEGVGKVATVVDKWADKRSEEAGKGIEAITGSKTAGGLYAAATRGAVEGVEMLGAGPEKVGARTAVTAIKSAETAAKDAGIAWDTLHSKTKALLDNVVKSSGNLSGVDPKALARIDRANKAGVPITRGQATRDLGQITQEENIARTDTGKPIRTVNTNQDIGLHSKLDTMRKDTGGKAETRQQLGKSVQGAERAKLRSLEADYRAKYRKAQQNGATKGPVDATPLDDWLNVPANSRNAGYLRSALEDYKKDASGSITINDLEQVRKEANVKVGSTDKTEAHYANQAVKVIDDILDAAGDDSYKAARQAFKKTREEFDRQGLVKSLTSEKGRTTDRAVALEDTFDKVVRSGSNEQLEGLLKSLTTGGSAKTKELGQQAVKDLRAATLDYLKEAAAGKRAIRGEDEQLQFNSSFIDAMDELDKDGKLTTLFGEKGTAALRELRDLTRDLRTKPADRIAGPNTTPRLLAALDKLSKIPYVGDPLRGVVEAGKKVTQWGKEGRETSRALTNPIEERGKPKSSPTNRLKDLRRIGGVAPATLDQLNE